MKAEVREWWLALADQYEEWAENPPLVTIFKTPSGSRVLQEEYTCCTLYLNKNTWGFRPSAPRPEDCLLNLWEEKYGTTAFPAGEIGDLDRPQKRFDFCWWMAERIREELGEEA